MRFKQKLLAQINIRLIAGGVGGIFVLFLLMTPILIAAQHAYEYLTPTEHWYIYHDITPAKPVLAVNEPVRFNSYLEYKQSISVRWEDTLYCKINGDGVEKLKTQHWPSERNLYEKKHKQLINLYQDKQGVLRPVTYPIDLQFWSYTAQTIPANATECQAEHVIVGRTPLGYIKPYWTVSEAFKVNQ
jgi:hypothetical protein